MRTRVASSLSWRTWSDWLPHHEWFLSSGLLVGKDSTYDPILFGVWTLRCWEVSHLCCVLQSYKQLLGDMGRAVLGPITLYQDNLSTIIVGLLSSAQGILLLELLTSARELLLEIYNSNIVQLETWKQTFSPNQSARLSWYVWKKTCA